MSASVPLGRWVIACTLGEVLGFGLGGAIGVASFLAVPEPTTVPLAIALLSGCVLAGAIEGSILAAAQARVLRAVLPGLDVWGLCRATGLFAAAAWALGALPSTILALTGAAVASDAAPYEPDPILIVAVSALGGLCAGAVLGAAQERVLRRAARGTHGWILANAIGWALALPWSYLAGGSAAAASGPAAAIAVCLGVGLVMGATVALATAVALRAMQPLAGTLAAR